MALPRLRVCQERSAVRQQWPGSSQDVLRAHERLSWMEPWQLLWRRVDICSSSSISRSVTTRSSRLRRSPILHACASCTLQSSTTDEPPPVKDRKSTRLNSSHRQISYAVFCLKKKKKNGLVLVGDEVKNKDVDPLEQLED